MKKIIYFILYFSPIVSFSQNSFFETYQKADSLLNSEETEKAYKLYAELEQNLSKADTLYRHALWYKVITATILENTYRLQCNFEKSLLLGFETLDEIKKGIPLFGDNFMKRKYFMMKNIIVSYYGLENYKEGNKWKSKMYKAHKKQLLPEGISEYFNYDFFKFEDKNVWGYEWFEELPKNRFSRSFTKVVYYVYSTNPDGSDKEQLYRLHVLMFHGNNKNFDYVMDKRLETATSEVSGTLYSYTYKKNIDYEKLKNDVKEILKGNIQPDTKRTTTRGKNGKTDVMIEVPN